MGKRCRQAAWGATFALLVAACAATEAPRTAPTGRSNAAERAPAESVQFPRTLADASFVRAELPGGRCVSGDDSRVSLYDPTTGERHFSFTTPRPSGLTVVDEPVAYVGFAWDRNQPPGIGAIDLVEEAPMWQRFLDDQPEQIEVRDDRLILVSRAGIRALDAATGADLWATSTEFQLREVVLADEQAYGMNAIGVYAFDLTDGSMMWELPIDRPDELVASGDLLAVTAGPTLMAVDLGAQALLWEEEVNRVGAGAMWVGPESVVVELAPSANPAGAIAGYDRVSGRERWRLDRVGDIEWTGADQLVTTISAAERRPGFSHDLVGVSASSGEVEWAMPLTDGAESLVGAAPGRVLVSDPHPMAPGHHRLQLLRTADGRPIWSAVRLDTVDGASIARDSSIAFYRNSTTLRGDRGEVGVVRGVDHTWAATEADGIAAPPVATREGLLVVSGEPVATCVGRELLGPDSVAAVGDES